MARHKEFDPEEALARARSYFHAHGFSQTSMQELLAEMGIGQGSFYGTFGSKQEVFELALDTYLEAAVGHMVARVGARDDPRAAIGELLATAATIYGTDPAHRGCFGVNTVVERAAHDPVLATRLRKHWERLERALTKALTRACASRQLSSQAEPRVVARLLVAVIHGMAVRSKYDPRPEPLKEIAKTMAALL